MRSAATLGALALCWAAWATPVGAQIYVWTDERGVVHFTDSPRHAGFQRRALPASASGRWPSHGWDDLIERASNRYAVPAALVKAVIHAESAFDPGALSPKGARGLMQLMPGTARELGVDDAFNPWQNISGGTRYLGQLLERYPGQLDHALAAYNAGPRQVAHFGGIPPYRETRRYVRKVIKLYRRYDADDG